MLLPRFTLRTGLVTLTVASVLSIVVREAWLGEPWAIGLALSLAGLIALLGLHALLLVASLALSRTRGAAGKPPERA